MSRIDPRVHTMRRKRYFDEDDRCLARDPDNSKLGGVCAGVARFLDVPAFAIRAIAVVSLLIAPQVTLIAYGLSYFILDERPYRSARD